MPLILFVVSTAPSLHASSQVGAPDKNVCGLFHVRAWVRSNKNAGHLETGSKSNSQAIFNLDDSSWNQVQILKDRYITAVIEIKKSSASAYLREATIPIGETSNVDVATPDPLAMKYKNEITTLKTARCL